MDSPGRATRERVERRAFLSRISIALGALAAAVMALPPVATLLGPIVRPRRGVWRPVGPESGFSTGATVEVTFRDPSPERWSGVASEMGAWLRREQDGSFTAFSLDCTHLGCPVRWLPDADLFMCPCHGGVFYRDGQVAAGPPPEPLKHHPVRVRNGQVEVWTRPIPIVG